MDKTEADTNAFRWGKLARARDAAQDAAGKESSDVTYKKLSEAEGDMQETCQNATAGGYGGE